MLHKQKTRIMELFFEEPAKNFQLRETSRMTGIAVTSTKKYLHELEKEGMLRKNKETLYPSYSANETSRLFKIQKMQSMMLKIYASELIDFLEDQLHPTCIILFGSVRKGEYTKKSDIDIYIQSTEQELTLTEYEKKLRHKISIIFEPRIQDLSEELFNTVVNGIILSGYLKIKRGKNG